MTAEQLRKLGFIPRGTRCDRIMELIDSGLDDSSIARQIGGDVDTIAVYRMWHDGTLTEPANEGESAAGRTAEGETPDYVIAWFLHKARVGYNEIARKMGRTRAQVRRLIYYYADKNRGKAGDKDGLQDEN